MSRSGTLAALGATFLDGVGRASRYRNGIKSFLRSKPLHFCNSERTNLPRQQHNRGHPPKVLVEPAVVFFFLPPRLLCCTRASSMIRRKVCAFSASDISRTGN